MDLQWNEAVEFVKSRDAELRRLPYDELASLPSFGESAQVANPRHWRKIQVYVYADKMPKGRLRVIAQAWRLYVLGFSKSHTEGFELERDGTIEPLDPNGSWW